MIEEFGSPTAGNDRRYWRRRRNREVLRARRTRITFLAGRAIVLNLLVLGILSYVGYETFGHVTTAPQFALREIAVEGTRRLSPEDVRRRLAPLAGRNLLEVDLSEAAASVATDPLVARASVRRILPGTLRVEIEEREPAALAIVRKVAHVVARDGFVLGPAAPGILLDRPLLNGLDSLEGDALVRALASGVAALERLTALSPALVGETSELDLSHPDRLVLVPKGPGPVFLLDPENIEQNLREYLSLRTEIEKRWGEADRVDLRWRDRISILPEAREPELEND